MALASEIIELRQADRDDQGPAVAGKWSVSLNEPLGLKEGDTVAVRNVYLDTEASADSKIHIADALDLDMQIGYYYQGIRTDKQVCNQVAQPAYLTDSANGFIDGETYVMCESQPVADMVFMGSIEMSSTHTNYDPIYHDSWRPNHRGTDDGNGPIILIALDVIYKVKEDDLTHNTTLFLNGVGQTGPASVSRGWEYQDQNQNMGRGLDGWNYYASSSDLNAPFTEDFAYDPTKQVSAEINGQTFTTNGMMITGFQAYKPDASAGCGDRAQGADSLGFPNPDFSIGTQQKYQLNFKSLGQSYTIDMYVNLPGTNDASDMPYVPFKQTATLHLPAGSYAPQELCTVLNRQMQTNNSTDPTNPILNSKFLLKVNNTTFPNTTYAFFKDGDAANAFVFDTADNDPDTNGGILIGATQMVLDYDTDKGVFFWSYLHSPIYGLEGAASTNEAVGFGLTENLVTNDGQPVAIARNSGIYFVQLSAKLHSNQKPYPNFWASDLTADPNSTSVLGFDSSTLFVHDGVKQAGPAGLANGVVLPSQRLVAGTNTTSGFLALDDLATRSVDSTKYWFMPTIAAGTPALSASNGVTQEIRAEPQAGQGDNIDFGYFLIDIASQWGAAKFVGAKGYRSDNIRAVVGRYYSQASYTTGTEADAIPYTHKGLPIVLNSFDIEILAPNKQIAPNLGTDSAVFLEVVRAPPTPPAQAAAAEAGGGAGK